MTDHTLYPIFIPNYSRVITDPTHPPRLTKDDIVDPRYLRLSWTSGRWRLTTGSTTTRLERLTYVGRVPVLGPLFFLGHTFIGVEDIPNLSLLRGQAPSTYTEVLTECLRVLNDLNGPEETHRLLNSFPAGGVSLVCARSREEYPDNDFVRPVIFGRHPSQAFEDMLTAWEERVTYQTVLNNRASNFSDGTFIVPANPTPRDPEPSTEAHLEDSSTGIEDRTNALYNELSEGLTNMVADHLSRQIERDTRRDFMRQIRNQPPQDGSEEEGPVEDPFADIEFRVSPYLDPRSLDMYQGTSPLWRDIFSGRTTSSTSQVSPEEGEGQVEDSFADLEARANAHLSQRTVQMAQRMPSVDRGRLRDVCMWTTSLLPPAEGEGTTPGHGSQTEDASTGATQEVSVVDYNRNLYNVPDYVYRAMRAAERENVGEAPPPWLTEAGHSETQGPPEEDTAEASSTQLDDQSSEPDMTSSPTETVDETLQRLGAQEGRYISLTLLERALEERLALGFSSYKDIFKKVDHASVRRTWSSTDDLHRHNKSFYLDTQDPENQRLLANLTDSVGRYLKTTFSPGRLRDVPENSDMLRMVTRPKLIGNGYVILWNKIYKVSAEDIARGRVNLRNRIITTDEDEYDTGPDTVEESSDYAGLEQSSWNELCRAADLALQEQELEVQNTQDSQTPPWENG